ncbi:hypothetical protein ERJ75_001730200 [Trypanosoma vivax]|nr:hypothetical protein TRVL_04916 [Trypanosoma vivax]KAH8604182.1 hypothetical protein ERJ75_001730200 [Trypanosoma vivax]
MECSDLVALSARYSYNVKDDPYEWVSSLWSCLRSLQSDTSPSHAGPSPEDVLASHAPAIPVAVLYQWRSYAAFCRWTVPRHIDWREILAYVYDGNLDSNATGCSSMSSRKGDDAVTYPVCDRPSPFGNLDGIGETAGSCEVMRTGSSISLIRHLSSECTKRFGKMPLYVHQQRLLRWTRMLGQCIMWRVLAAKDKSVPVSLRELQQYQLIFLPYAREVVGASAQIRLLATLLEAGVNEVVCDSSAVMDQTHLGTTYLRDELAHTFTLTLVVSPQQTPRELSAQPLAATVARSLDAVWVDNLHISWFVMDPKNIPDKVRSRLLGPMSSHETDYTDFSPMSGSRYFKLHSASLQPLLLALCALGTGNGSDISLGVSTSTPSLELHQLQYVIQLLETAGYVMLTKLRRLCALKCYSILPFIADYIKLRNLVKRTALSNLVVNNSAHSIAGGCKACTFVATDIVDMLLRGLVDCTRSLYAEYVGSCLHRYSSTAMHRPFEFHVKPTEGSTGDKLVTLSQAGLSLLEGVVEPTLFLLHMVMLNGESYSQEDVEFVHFFVDMLRTVLNAGMDEVQKCTRDGSSAQKQSMNDRELLMRYINFHPVLVQLAGDNS